MESTVRIIPESTASGSQKNYEIIKGGKKCRTLILTALALFGVFALTLGLIAAGVPAPPLMGVLMSSLMGGLIILITAAAKKSKTERKAGRKAFYPLWLVITVSIIYPLGLFFLIIFLCAKRVKPTREMLADYMRIVSENAAAKKALREKYITEYKHIRKTAIIGTLISAACLLFGIPAMIFGFMSAGKPTHNVYEVMSNGVNRFIGQADIYSGPVIAMGIVAVIIGLAVLAWAAGDIYKAKSKISEKENKAGE